MPSAIWTGSISFGLVTVPVRLVSATKSLDVRFHQLEAEHRRRGSATDGCRSRPAKRSPTTRSSRATSSSPASTSSSSPTSSPRWQPKASRQIEIEDFVDLSDIDPVYFEQPYYLVPDKDAREGRTGSSSDVMEELGKVAVGRFVLRSKEALVAIRPVDGVLVPRDDALRRRGARARPRAADPEAESEPSERELEMARQLVSVAHGDVRSREVPRRVPRGAARAHRPKAAGEEIVAPAAPEEPAKVLDLMAALEASLARAGAKQTKSGRTPAKKAATRTAASKSTKRAPAKKAAAKKASSKKVTPKRTRKSA